MNDDAPHPEADRVDGAPHPRATQALFGQKAAEQEFLDAWQHGRLHHAWLLSGPRGVGKATLAWRIARFLLAEPPANTGGMFGDTLPAPTSLDLSQDHPVNRRVAALSDPGLYLLRRTWNENTNRLNQEIVVDNVRGLRGFFALSAADGGHRVVIVDAADEMNISAANALLKMLEEPPKGATLILISHQPTRLLPTIRSRCRPLRLATLGPDDMAQALAQAGVADIANPEALATLAGGSVGEALRLINMGGLEIYSELAGLCETLPGMDRPRLLRLANSVVGKTAANRFALVLDMMDLFLSRMARTGITGPPETEGAPGEASLLARLSPGADAGRAWAELQHNLSARARHGQAVNLDPAALILDMGLKIDQTAAKWAARQGAA